MKSPVPFQFECEKQHLANDVGQNGMDVIRNIKEMLGALGDERALIDLERASLNFLSLN